MQSAEVIIAFIISEQIQKEQITQLAIDNQQSISTDIYEGERKQCKCNFKIGNIELNLKNQHRRGDNIKVLYLIKKDVKVKTKANKFRLYTKQTKMASLM